jgi:hypothetical protein
MYIKDLVRNGLEIPGNSLYNSEKWFISSKNWILPILQRYYGRREVLDSIADDSESVQDIVADVESTIVVLFALNTWKYKHLYNLYSAEYNPIWNVDGTEVTTTKRETIGTKDSTDSKSGTDTLSYSGSESLGKTGDDTLEYLGSSSKGIAGTVTGINSGDVQQARTTFDSDTDYDTDKTTDSTKHETVYGKTALGTSDPYAEMESFTGRKDKTTYNSSDTRSFTDREDATTYNSSNTLDEDTTEKVVEEITHTRGGNIGVTMTQEMFKREMDLVGQFKFFDQIAHDIANTISYN